MNRQFKFRAWDNENNQMANLEDGDYCLGFNSNGRLVLQGYNPEDGYTVERGEFSDSDWAEVDAEIMQFTGLKDKEGTEIYEKDILVLANKKWIIKITSYGALGDTIDGTRGNWNITEWADDMKIIGNIYENPELL